MLEVLAGVSFLSISFLGLTSLSLMTIRATSEARHISAATNLARTKIEELRGADYASLTSGADANPIAEDGEVAEPGSIYRRSWTVGGGPTPTTKQVVVSVSWGEQAARRVSLSTAIAE